MTKAYSAKRISGENKCLFMIGPRWMQESFMHFTIIGLLQLIVRSMMGFCPPDYYSLPEQVAGLGDPDVLALQLTLPNQLREPVANGTHASSKAGGMQLQLFL